MEKILVSACLMGEVCRYSGGSNYNKDVAAFFEKNKDSVKAVLICPEVDGGLSTPREPAEIKDRKVITKDGKDVTASFVKGARKTALLAKALNCHRAILKERSPSCGSGEIYDGTFTQVLIKGDGKTAALLKQLGVKIYGESQIKQLEE